MTETYRPGLVITSDRFEQMLKETGIHPGPVYYNRNGQPVFSALTQKDIDKAMRWYEEHPIKKTDGESV